ncbi:MAG: rhodanese-like domain-containing protein [Ekhidna sp.]|nr:rhodanese-like domain-containing protein [Ekhidna sp.]
MKEITVLELKKLMDEKADFQLIDVRRKDEYDFANLNGELITLDEVPQNIEKIHRDKKVIMQCRSGKRSADAIAYLEQNHGFDNLYNLKGGILAWSDEVDPTVPKY